MRNINCGNVRREIQGAEPNDLLSAAVRTHLASCPACETLARQQSSLHALVSGLGTVEAPSDFEFRLRSRLAGEGQASSRFYAMKDFSFGLRAAALASVLLLIGSVFFLATFRTRPASSGVAELQPLPANPATPEPAPVEPAATLKAPSNASDKKDTQAIAGGGSHRPSTVKINKGGRPVGTLEQVQTMAPSFKASDEALGSYPTEAFQINATNQSLKVSVDNGRGAYRTISLPTVSFGSQRALSQNASPLMASARGDW